MHFAGFFPPRLLKRPSVKQCNFINLLALLSNNLTDIYTNNKFSCQRNWRRRWRYVVRRQVRYGHEDNEATVDNCSIVYVVVNGLTLIRRPLFAWMELTQLLYLFVIMVRNSHPMQFFLSVERTGCYIIILLRGVFRLFCLFAVINIGLCSNVLGASIATRRNFWPSSSDER